MGSGTQAQLTSTRELSGRIPEVAPKDYRTYSDSALDGEIVASVDAAQGHYNGLRREVVLRLLPALAEMRRRHGAQGARNDLNQNLGLPKRAGWEEYLRSRGLRPDTVRNWFQKFTAAKTLGLLVSGDQSKPSRTPSPKVTRNEPRLYRVSGADQVLVVAANSAKHALAILAGTATGVVSDSNLKVVEVGQVMQLSGAADAKAATVSRLAPEPTSDAAVADASILDALMRNPAASPNTVARNLHVSAVTVRRVAMRYRLHINAVVNSDPTSHTDGLD